MGNAPADTGQRKTQRTTQVIEVEFGPKAKPSSAKESPMDKEGMMYTQAPQTESMPVESAPVSLPVEVKMQEYKVKKGDTLQKISKEFYGTTKKWMKIYNANRDILKGPDKIYPGQVIDVPLEGLKEPKENLK
jgi:nucleoid-associated protein YgaU